MAWARPYTGPYRGQVVRAGIVALALVAIVGAAWWRLAPPRQVVVAELPATAAFLAAYARGDEIGAERVASPLFDLERTRRSWTSNDRARPPRPLERDRRLAPRLRFTLAG